MSGPRDPRGAPVRAGRGHESALAHVTGRASFLDDLPALEGELRLAPVPAPVARARILRIDPAPAYEVPGVVRVLSAADVPGLNDAGPIVHDEPLLPADEVRYHRQAVAWVAAESDEAARRGAAAVRLELEPLPAVLDPLEALAQGLEHGTPQRMGVSDEAIEAALAAAPVRVEGELALGGQEHAYLETHAARAEATPEGDVRVWSGTQHPSETQAVVAHVLGLARHRVTVTCPRMGGAFGGKESQAAPFAAVAALAAWLTGRPARVRLRRDDDVAMTGKRHPFRARWRAGAGTDGRLLALDAALVSDGGWSADLSLPVMQRALFHVGGPYAWPALRVTGRVARTDRPSNTAFRGFGGPQGAAVAEEAVDRLARALGRPPAELRRRNLLRPGADRTHYGQRVLEPRLERVWDELADESDLDARRAEVDAANRAAGRRGGVRRRGLAITPVAFGISFTNTPLNQAGALTLVYADGSVQVNHGGTEMGQGLHAKMLAVAAAELGVPPERIRVMPTATDKVPNTSATAASSGSDLNGMAVADACRAVRASMAAVAARMLGVDGPEDLAFEGGAVFPRGEPDRSVGFDEVAARAHLERVPLFSTGYYRTPNLHFDRESGTGRPFAYHAFGAAVAEVEVCGLTGRWRLLRADLLCDAGSSLDERIDLGQVEGGFVQGMGWLTMEDLVTDAEGRLRTDAFATYKIPTASEVPPAVRARLLERAAQPGTIRGSKAVGEPPFLLALSVREAIRDAVAAFAGAPPERVALDAPSTPEAILRAVEAVRTAAPLPDADPAPARPGARPEPRPDPAPGD